MSDVIDIFRKKEEAVEEEVSEEITEEEAAELFKATMERNQAIREKLAKERLTANKSVLKTYKLKKKD